MFKKIKIIFWKLLRLHNDINIKIASQDLKIFEKRSLKIEKRLGNLGVDKVVYDPEDIELDVSNMYPKIMIEEVAKCCSGGHTLKFDNREEAIEFLNVKFGVVNNV